MENPPHEALSEYHRFVGFFVSEFAQLEFILRFIIRALSGLNERTYDALIGFPRSGEARAMAKKLADLHPLEPDARNEINAAFAHLADIVTLRDRIIHYGGHPLTSGEIALFAKEKPGEPTALDKHQQQNLWDAAHDLFEIKGLFIYYLIPGASNHIAPDEYQRQGPWRYKPPQQANTHQKRGSQKEQPNPPAS